MRVSRAARAGLALPLLLGAAGACDRAGPGPESALGAPVELASPAGPGSAEPTLTTGPDGRVYLSWVEPAADSTHALRFAVREGEGWTEPRTIARGRDWFVNWADFPSLVVLPDGRMAAHYLERDPGGRSYDYGVRIVQSADGGRSWSAPVVPHRDGVAAEHGFVSLFPLEGDSLGAVWLDGRKYDARYGGTKEMTVRFTSIAPDGALGPETTLDERACDCCQTAQARTSRGPVVVYRDRSPGEVRDILVTRRLEGRWTEGVPVHADGWRIDACPVNGPAVAAEGERVAVAWFTAARDTARVLVAFSGDAGATFGPPIRVDGGSPAGRVDVELTPGGRALVSWLENTGEGGAEVRARVVGAAGEVGEPRVVARSSGARASGFPRMTRSGEEVLFAWTEPGSVSRVRVARARVGGAS